MKTFDLLTHILNACGVRGVDDTGVVQIRELIKKEK